MKVRTDIQNNNYRHGLSRHPLCGTWYRMVRRCTVEPESQYADYGGRGIQVRPQWLNVANYIKYVEEHLEARPNALCTLDRIDNDGDYASRARVNFPEVVA